MRYCGQRCIHKHIVLLLMQLLPNDIRLGKQFVSSVNYDIITLISMWTGECGWRCTRTRQFHIYSSSYRAVGKFGARKCTSVGWCDSSFVSAEFRRNFHITSDHSYSHSNEFCRQRYEIALQLWPTLMCSCLGSNSIDCTKH